MKTAAQVLMSIFFVSLANEKYWIKIDAVDVMLQAEQRIIVDTRDGIR